MYSTVYILGTEDMYTTSGNSVLALCAAGERVWVQSAVSDCHISGGAGMHSSFTGFLVNQVFER